MIARLLVVLTVSSLMLTLTCRPTFGQKRTRSDVAAIRVDKLNRSKVLGSLGYALGEVVTIEGVMADENYTKRKADAGALLLRAQVVNGRTLKGEVVLAFSPFSGIELKNPTVGVRFKYTGYETGGFAGIPEKAFAYVPRVATTGFYFSTSFVVLRDEQAHR